LATCARYCRHTAGVFNPFLTRATLAHSGFVKDVRPQPFTKGRFYVPAHRGVFKLDARPSEIEHNTSLTTQAAIIVVIVALLGGVGGGILAGTQNLSFLNGFISQVLSILFGWLLWSVSTWFVGTRFFKGTADVSEMLRVIGFAYVPQVLTIIPCVGLFIGAIWTLAAGFVAIRQGLGLDNTKAFFTVLIGFVLYMLLSMALGSAKRAALKSNIRKLV
jgi:hypothetical protein